MKMTQKHFSNTPQTLKWGLALVGRHIRVWKKVWKLSELSSAPKPCGQLSGKKQEKPSDVRVTSQRPHRTCKSTKTNARWAIGLPVLIGEKASAQKCFNWSSTIASTKKASRFSGVTISLIIPPLVA